MAKASESIILQKVYYIPDALEPSTLYWSGEFEVAVHLCCCGCGERVVTPLDKVIGWVLDEATVSLHPSIGNFQIPCRTHYWIQNGTIVWV